MPSFIDANEELLRDGDKLVIKRFQDIPDEFLAELREERTHTRLRPGQEVNRVACIPVALADRWLLDGFDLFKESNKAIVAKLNAEGLGYFVTARGV